MSEKILSLLRPLDFTQLKIGDEIVWLDYYNYLKVYYIGGPDDDGIIAIRTVDASGSNNIYTRYQTSFAMKPLAWVDGKPVYAGDTLFVKGIANNDPNGYKVVTSGRKGVAGFSSTICLYGIGWFDVEKLTWEKPRTKKTGWIAIYNIDRPVADKNVPIASGSNIYSSREFLENVLTNSDYKDIVQITWEE